MVMKSIKPIIRSLLTKILVCSPLLVATEAQGIVLVQTSDPGFYNNNIGTVLNLSNTGVDDANEPFPVSNDSRMTFPTAPDLSAADTVLGNWLPEPGSLNSNWSSTPISIPNSWDIGTEVAVIYQFDTAGATDVVARFGVDNGIYAWLDGEYLFGARAPGGVISLNEYELQLGDFEAGTRYLQLLLEDHGSANGYAVEITAETFLPPDTSVPEPSSVAAILILKVLATTAFLKRRVRI